MIPNREQFVQSLAEVQAVTHGINVSNGFWGTLNRIAEQGEEEKVCVILSRIGLIHSEPSEAAEAVRKHDPSTWADPATKDTLVRELAGSVVRIMDLAQWLNMPLGEAILAELENNAKRGFMHGGKRG